MHAAARVLSPLPVLMTYFFLFVHPVHAWIQYTSSGEATMTHYSLPTDFIAACGCTTDTAKYPTAAFSQQAYGSSTSYGPGCGRCFNLTLLNTYEVTPPFFPDVVKSVVIKVTDLCPMGGAGWCSATEGKKNQGGAYLNFDLVYPSDAIPEDFFPSNKDLYGFTDYGVWNVSYESISCQYWAGWKDVSALGSVASLGTSACCPANPTIDANETCPSYSDANGIPPDTSVGSSSTADIRAVFIPSQLLLMFVTVVYGVYVLV